MKYFDWDDAKNAKLRTERGIGFEEIVFHIERGDLLDILEHPNPERYGGQRIFVVRREDYVYLVPFVEDEHTVFLKTIIPSRKATKEYLGEESTMKIDADEKELLESVERGEWKSAKAASANERATPIRQGYVPQGPAAEHSALEQGPGGNPEARARRRPAVPDADLEPVAQVHVRSPQRRLKSGRAGRQHSGSAAPTNGVCGQHRCRRPQPARRTTVSDDLWQAESRDHRQRRRKRVNLD